MNERTLTPPAHAQDELHRVGDAFVVVGNETDAEIRCSGCGFTFGPRTEDPKLGAVVAERSITTTSELNRHGAVDDLVLREFYCPGCGSMIAANVQRHGDPVLREIELG
jgi:acetone carboxylase gamma subunit